MQLPRENSTTRWLYWGIWLALSRQGPNGANIWSGWSQAARSQSLLPWVFLLDGKKCPLGGQRHS